MQNFKNVQNHLMLEHKKWRKDHKWGFVAVPKRRSSGFIDYFDWSCVVPGPEGTAWENGRYRLSMVFGFFDYPSSPPLVTFEEQMYHPNVTTEGTLIIDMLNPRYWHRTYTIKDVLYRVNDVLDKPEAHNIVNCEAADEYHLNNKAYNERIKVFALTTRHSEE